MLHLRLALWLPAIGAGSSAGSVPDGAEGSGVTGRRPRWTGRRVCEPLRKLQQRRAAPRRRGEAVQRGLGAERAGRGHGSG